MNDYIDFEDFWNQQEIEIKTYNLSSKEIAERLYEHFESRIEHSDKELLKAYDDLSESEGRNDELCEEIYNLQRTIKKLEAEIENNKKEEQQ